MEVEGQVEGEEKGLERGKRGKVDLEELAREAGWSKGHFWRAFREVVGVTPGAFVLEARKKARMRAGVVRVEGAEMKGEGDVGREGNGRGHGLSLRVRTLSTEPTKLEEPLHLDFRFLDQMSTDADWIGQLDLDALSPFASRGLRESHLSWEGIPPGYGLADTAMAKGIDFDNLVDFSGHANAVALSTNLESEVEPRQEGGCYFGVRNLLDPTLSIESSISPQLGWDLSIESSPSPPLEWDLSIQSSVSPQVEWGFAEGILPIYNGSEPWLFA